MLAMTRRPRFLALFFSLLLAAPALAQAAPGGAAVAAVSDKIEIDISLKVAMGPHRFSTKQAMIVKNDKTATMTIKDNDAKYPVESSVTVHPVLLAGGQMVQLQIKVAARAGDRTLSRTLDVTSPLNREGSLKDEKKDEKFELLYRARLK